MRSPGPVEPLHADSGFTLVETLMTLVLLGIMVTGISTLYVSGLQSLDIQEEDLLFEGALRSRMEWLLAQKIDQLAGGADTVTIAGQDYSLTWTVVGVDLNGDTVAEPNAFQIVATCDGRSQTTIVVDHQGTVGKI